MKETDIIKLIEKNIDFYENGREFDKVDALNELLETIKDE